MLRRCRLPEHRCAIAQGAAVTTTTEHADSDALWSTCRETLAGTLPEDQHQMYIAPLEAVIVDDCLWLCAPNRYLIDKLNRGLGGQITDSVRELSSGAVTEVRFRVGRAEEVKAAVPASEPAREQRNRGRASESVVEQAQLDLFRLERRGQFKAVAINASSEFPTLLTRIPIFIPGRVKRQLSSLDRDHALRFETPWGTGRKFGPPLSVYDEDTLMALGRLRQNMLIGPPANMPYPVSRLYQRNDDPNVHVHVVLCMISDIQRMCGTSSGGRNDRLRLESVRRLAGTKVEFSKETQKKVKSGTTIDLIHVKWDEYEENAVLYVQFSPIMAAWLETAYTYVDWNIRRQLRSDVGKAVHRFLSGQGKRYQIFTKKLQTTIGHTGRYKDFVADLREALGQLQELGWVSGWEISGNGRKYPHKLSIVR